MGSNLKLASTYFSMWSHKISYRPQIIILPSPQCSISQSISMRDSLIAEKLPKDRLLRWEVSLYQSNTNAYRVLSVLITVRLLNL